MIDETTTLTGVPNECWSYKVGNRNPIDWILNQYSETKYSEKVLSQNLSKRVLNEKFNTYKFADYKAEVIDLLKRVCTVSVETMKIIDEMNELSKTE
ncbi:MAG: hypothetical protein IPM74_17025 [Crocinitomicaceae bacterium]|nr:hypothetical protein [Crocinitomicaceae bacterium]